MLVSTEVRSLSRSSGHPFVGMAQCLFRQEQESLYCMSCSTLLKASGSFRPRAYEASPKTRQHGDSDMIPNSAREAFPGGVCMSSEGPLGSCTKLRCPANEWQVPISRCEPDTTSFCVEGHCLSTCAHFHKLSHYPPHASSNAQSVQHTSDLVPGCSSAMHSSVVWHLAYYRCQMSACRDTHNSYAGQGGPAGCNCTCSCSKWCTTAKEHTDKQPAQTQSYASLAQC